MKLRNKKTGEINLGDLHLDDFNSLAELNEEWEDVAEEPKERWYINENGGVMKYVPFDPDGEDLIYMKYQNEIGNYFETKEEAEKAVKKLEAWKRLKDKGFRFERWLLGGEYGNTITFSDYFESDDKTRADLDLLFGGEE